MTTQLGNVAVSFYFSSYSHIQRKISTRESGLGPNGLHQPCCNNHDKINKFTILRSLLCHCIVTWYFSPALKQPHSVARRACSRVFRFPSHTPALTDIRCGLSMLSNSEHPNPFQSALRLHPGRDTSTSSVVTRDLVAAVLLSTPEFKLLISRRKHRISFSELLLR